MKHKLFFLFLIANSFAITVWGQTVIKIPYAQYEIFEVEPRESTLPFDNGETLVIGNDIEIHGGSGQYDFTWTKDGNVIGQEPTLDVNEPGDYLLSVNDGQSCEVISVFHIGTSNSIPHVAEAKVHVYPNPVTDEFYLSYSPDIKPKAIEIYSMDGKLQEISNIQVIGVNTYKVDVSKYSMGYYLVVTKLEKSKITKVLLKQN